AAALAGEVARLDREKRRLESEDIPALREQLARAERKLEGIAAASAASPAPPARPAEARADGGGAVRAEGAPSSPPVGPRRRGGLLELEINGPRPVVIPELFRIASSDGDGEAARLAVNALEEILGPDGESEAAAAKSPPAGFAGWLDRSMKRIAGEVEVSA